MDNIEQIIKAAMLSARNEKQKNCAEVASFVYNVSKLQNIQDHVVKLQQILEQGSLTDPLRQFVNHTITENLSEIHRLQTSLNLECTEKILDVLKKKLGGR